MVINGKIIYEIFVIKVFIDIFLNRTIRILANDDDDDDDDDDILKSILKNLQNIFV